MDTVFLSYSFRNEDRLLVSSIEDLLESHDLRAVTGEVLEGRALSDAVKIKIGQADALVALMSPRQAKPGIAGRFRTSDWVRDEITHARAIEKPAIALVEKSVDVEGMNAERERIPYEASDLLPTFLKLSQTIAAWKLSSGHLATVRILPDSLRRVLKREEPYLRCEYRLTRSSNGEVLLPWQQARVQVRQGGAFALLPGVRSDSQIELRIQFPNERWESPATPQWLHVEVEKV
jgi:hypothetical protein